MTAQPERRFTLPRSVRLRTRLEFDRVFAARCSTTDRWMRLHMARNTTGYARVGLAVGRRHGNAVQRNRIKRLLREAFRHVRRELPPADYIIVPVPASEPTREALEASLRQLADILMARPQTREKRRPT